MPCPDIEPDEVNVFPQVMAFVLPPKEKWSDAFRHGYEEAVDLMRKSPRQRYATALEWDEYSLGYQHGINQKVASGDISVNGARELMGLPKVEDAQAETRGFNEAQNDFQPHPNDLKREPYVRGFKQGALCLYQEGRASRMEVTEKLLKIGFVPTDAFFDVPLIPAVPAQPNYDPVKIPSHYNSGQIEVANFIADQELDYVSGNVIKYVARAGKKNPDKEVEDLEKAAAYLQMRHNLANGLPAVVRDPETKEVVWSLFKN